MLGSEDSVLLRPCSAQGCMNCTWWCSVDGAVPGNKSESCGGKHALLFPELLLLVPNCISLKNTSHSDMCLLPFSHALVLGLPLCLLWF